VKSDPEPWASANKYRCATFVAVQGEISRQGVSQAITATKQILGYFKGFLGSMCHFPTRNSKQNLNSSYPLFLLKIQLRIDIDNQSMCRHLHGVYIKS
jgi:hypothetical protein